jgi:glycosyltransferase involved in cell wall biosynthesis
MSVTVVMPAHNEATILPAALRALRDESTGALELVVVANGCRDDTADVARRAGAAVIELAEASKVRALNAGLLAVERHPVAFVDADVVVRGADLVELANRLQADARAKVASPRMRVEASSSWLVRQYYRVWALTDYRSSGHIGSGVYMLDSAGADRLGAFPDVIADDTYVQRLFAPDERMSPADLEFTVRAPGSLRALVKRNTRIAAGNRQLAQRYPDSVPSNGRPGVGSLVRRVWRRPRLWVGFVVYSAVYVAAHRRAQGLLARREAIEWNRDETTREASA